YSVLHMVLTMDAYPGVKNKWRPVFYDPHTKILSVHDLLPFGHNIIWIIVGPKNPSGS
ncbi:hypothetical protein HN51_061629, partial [Arachis hypogaea]